ncbi:MAG: hypothetical protein IPL38_11340 [Rhodobacter sp.]|nr:hypothetical protein [Rhodobacter sp.]
MLGIDGMMQMQIDHRWLTFWPDGLFYDGTPPRAPQHSTALPCWRKAT